MEGGRSYIEEGGTNFTLGLHAESFVGVVPK